MVSSKRANGVEKDLTQKKVPRKRSTNSSPWT